MIAALIRWSIANRFLVLLATLMVAAWGVISLLRTPLDAIDLEADLVVYGRVGTNKAAKCLHGGGAFVWPLIQDYAYLSLEPIQTRKRCHCNVAPPPRV